MDDLGEIGHQTLGRGGGKDNWTPTGRTEHSDDLDREKEREREKILFIYLYK